MNAARHPTADVVVLDNPEWANTSVKHMDFNGDGREDMLMKLWVDNFGSYYLFRLVSTPGGGYSVPNPAETSPTSNSFFPVNWNDDGCTDMSTTVSIRIDACDGSDSHGIVIDSFGTKTGIDWDGDGRTDVIYPNGSETSIEVLRSSGSGALPVVGGGTAPNVNGNWWAPIDQNGDGLDDLIYSDLSGFVHLKMHNGSNVQPDLLTGVTDGYGVSAILIMTSCCCTSTSMTW